MSIGNVFQIGALICILAGCNYKLHSAQNKVKTNGTTYLSADSVMTSLANRYPLIISYTAYNSSGTTSVVEKNIACFSYHGNFAYKYRIVLLKQLGLGLKNSQLDSVSFTKAIGNQILKEIDNHELRWDLNYDDTENDKADNYCNTLNPVKPCYILDGMTYEMRMIADGRATLTKLYAPEKYESQCCKGNINRQKFIAIKNVIDRILSYPL